MEPSVDIRRLNGALVVTWQGPILSGPTGEHFGASVPMPARPGLLLVIDLRGVSRIDAFGVGALMAIVREARVRHVMLRLLIPDGRVGRLLVLCGLAQVALLGTASELATLVAGAPREASMVEIVRKSPTGNLEMSEWLKGARLEIDAGGAY